MNVYVYDIEVFINCFTITFRNIETGEIKSFVIYNNTNDIDELIDFLKDVKGLIGYNNLNYDYPILHFIMENQQRFNRLTILNITQLIYDKSQDIINSEYSAIRTYNVKILQLDLYRIWHFDNKNRATSLKHIEIAINFPNVEDFPYEHTHYVLPDQLAGILSYNLNDVNATYEFYKITKGQTELKLHKGLDKIQLRKDIKKEYGFDCINFNDVKIGDRINQVEYLKQKPGLTAHDLRELTPVVNPFTFGECIPDYIQFQTEELKAFYVKLHGVSVHIDQKQIFPIIFRGTKYIIAKGGIHSKDRPRKLESDENTILRDGDIGSQYPNAIAKRKLYPLHLGIEWLKGFIGNIVKRMAAKSKGIKNIAEALKLSLNGGAFGKMNESFNWQYSPFSHFACTIGNQFEILMLIEMLELEGFNVLSANTDGIVCQFDRSMNDKYYEICHKWEEIVGNTEMGQLEYTEYSKLIQTSVNDYMAQKTDGKLKFKGDFEVDKDIHKDHSMRIVRIALMRYFIFNIPVKDTIEGHLSRTENYEDDTANNGIYDFCLAKRALRGFKLQTHKLINSEQVITPQQKNTRYYISNTGRSFYKRKVETGKMERINVGYEVEIFNRYEEKEDYNINYQFYIKECNKIINQIEDKQFKLWDT